MPLSQEYSSQDVADEWCVNQAGLGTAANWTEISDGIWTVCYLTGTGTETLSGGTPTYGDYDADCSEYKILQDLTCNPAGPTPSP